MGLPRVHVLRRAAARCGAHDLRDMGIRGIRGIRLCRPPANSPRLRAPQRQPGTVERVTNPTSYVLKP